MESSRKWLKLIPRSLGLAPAIKVAYSKRFNIGLVVAYSSINELWYYK